MRRRSWTTAEVKEVLTRFHAEGPRTLARELNRSEDSIGSFARRIGMRTPRRSYRRSSLEVAAQ